jgi:hypothetical protein
MLPRRNKKADPNYMVGMAFIRQDHPMRAEK